MSEVREQIVVPAERRCSFSLARRNGASVSPQMLVHISWPFSSYSTNAVRLCSGCLSPVLYFCGCILNAAPCIFGVGAQGFSKVPTGIGAFLFFYSPQTINVNHNHNERGTTATAHSHVHSRSRPIRAAIRATFSRNGMAGGVPIAATLPSPESHVGA